ncbi:MAG: response regulator [Burkholderiaceae bacterium]
MSSSFPSFPLRASSSFASAASSPGPAGAEIAPLVQLVDDDAGVRAALALLLATVGLRTAAWADPTAFLAGFAREAIGAIVLDVRMPGISGLAVLERLREQGVDQPVIMLTGHGTVDMCRRAFRGGAVDFLEKPVDDDRLIEAVLDAVGAHGRARERHAADRETRERYQRLSPREREVLARVVAGRTNKLIARELGLSPRTVETHRTHLSMKLEVGSLAALIRRYGVLVEPPVSD